MSRAAQATDLDNPVLAGFTTVARVWSGSIDCGRLARAIVPASPPPVRVTLLCRAVTLCAAVERWLRRHDGAMWYHLVHDSFFVISFDQGTIIFPLGSGQKVTEKIIHPLSLGVQVPAPPGP